MPRFLKFLSIAAVLTLFIFSLSFAVSLPEEITITTYYPSPVGSYHELQLAPYDPSPAEPSTCTAEGTMYYNLSGHQLRICSNGTWKPAPGEGAGGAYWQLAANGQDIYNNNNSGNGNVGIGKVNNGAKLNVYSSIPTPSYSIGIRVWMLDVLNSEGVYSRGNQRGIYGGGETLSSIGVEGVTFGTQGIGVRGEAVTPGGATGIGVYGQGPVGVKGWGVTSDFYADGPGVNYDSSSSIRWKMEIRPIDNVLDKVLSLRGVSFRWDKEHGGKNDVGMIAEEVGKVFPEFVSYEADGKNAMGMDYGKLTCVLVEAIKELQGQIKEQDKQIKELQSRLEIR